MRMSEQQIHDNALNFRRLHVVTEKALADIMASTKINQIVKNNENYQSNDINDLNK